MPNFLTAHQSLANYCLIVEIKYAVYFTKTGINILKKHLGKGGKLKNNIVNFSNYILVRGKQKLVPVILPLIPDLF